MLFASPHSDMKSKIFTYDQRMHKFSILEHPDIHFKMSDIVQVGNSIYCYKPLRSKWTKHTVIDSKITIETKNGPS